MEIRLTRKLSGKKLGKTSGEIVELMKSEPTITIPELANQLARTERAILSQISKLKNEKAIRRVGPDKGGFWEVLF